MSDKIIHLTDDSFDTDVLKADGAILVDFWAEWCGPCKMMSPIFEEFEAENEGKCSFYKMNVDNDGAVAASLGIVSIPTIVYFADGIAKEKIVGLTTKEDLAEGLKRL